MFITALFYYKKKRKSKYPSKNLKLWTFTKWTRSPLMTCENAHEIIKIHNYDNNAIYAVSVTYLLCVSTNIKEGDRTDSLKMPTKVSQGLRCSIFKKNLHIQFL